MVYYRFFLLHDAGLGGSILLYLVAFRETVEVTHLIFQGRRAKNLSSPKEMAQFFAVIISQKDENLNIFQINAISALEKACFRETFEIASTCLLE